jgi:hypothetical protein
MASDQAKQIVDQIFGDEKAKAVDSVQDALAAISYDAIQQRKLEFAKSMGFELDDTAQDAADEIADNLPDGTEELPEPTQGNVETSEEEPVDTAPSSIDPPTSEQEPIEEPNDETDR